MEEQRRAVAQRYRQLSHEEKERDLRERLGIGGRWPYYLCKKGAGPSAFVEREMIWQAALFSRFIFKKANPNFELKQASTLQWVAGRFEKSAGAGGRFDSEVRRYLGYLAACGFLSKLPYSPYESQGYTVVHGELAPPARPERGALGVAQRAIPLKVAVSPPEPPPASLPTGPDRWIWRASWPRWSDISDQIASLLATSTHANYLEALLGEISPFTRPDDPFECAEMLENFGVPPDETMTYLEHLGLVLKLAPRPVIPSFRR